MEASVLVGCLAAAFAFAVAFSAVLSASALVRRRGGSLAAQGGAETALGPVANLVAWRMRNGFPWAFDAVRLLARLRPAATLFDEAAALCRARGLMATNESAASVLVVATAAVAAVVGLVTASPVAAVATAACILAVAATVAGSARDKRHEALREAVPGALESMAACLGSGFTLLQTFQQVAADTPGPLGEVFARSAHLLETGSSAERALDELRTGAHASELAFVAVALDVQHQTGGAMRQVLDAATDSVKGELALRRALRVQTAQAKLSARVVVVMPFVLVAAFSFASPDFLSPFFSSVTGYALLAVALAMQVAGIVLVRRALAVDGVV